MTSPRATDPLAAIRERCEAATPGPWQITRAYLRPGTGMCDVVTCEDEPTGVACDGDQLGHAHGACMEADGEFIAHARQDVPALLAALTAVLDKLDDIDLVLRLNDLGHSGKALGVASSDLRFVIAESLGVLPVEES